MRHVEHAEVALGTERENSPRVESGQQATVPEIMLYQINRESINAGGYRGMSGKHGARANSREHLIKAEPILVNDLARAFQAEETRVPLVGVKNLRLRMSGQLAVAPDGPHPADAGQNFLPNPVVGIAAVEPVGHPAQVFLVGLDVSIQQQQRNPTDPRPP